MYIYRYILFMYISNNVHKQLKNKMLNKEVKKYLENSCV